MKQNVGPAGIAVGVVVLIVVGFVLYRIFLPPPSAVALTKETGFHRPGYTAPAVGGQSPAAPTGGSQKHYGP